MSARCPEGHLSESLDYCDSCGSPMGAADAGVAGSAQGAAGPDNGPQAGSDGSGAMAQEPSDRQRMTQAPTLTCPHCGALNVADALFCEACGYDFTTGTPPMGAEPSPAEGVDEVEEPQVVEEPPVEEPQVAADGEADPADAPLEEPGSTEEDADEAAAGTEDDPQTADTPEPDAEPDEEPGPEADAKPEPDEEPDEEPGPKEAAQPDEEPAAPPLPPQPAREADRTVPPQRRARHTPPSRALAQAWVVELWVDPDWYAVQQTTEAIPSPGVPDIVLLTRNGALIGRPSGTLGARPEVDAGVDSAVSRRHAQLTSDGRRWWIEDLGSSNGTFVGTVGEPLPSAPITPGQRVEIDRDDRVYLGAWTRLVLRQATASEQRGTG